jgi:hypothetical protein
MVGRSEDYGDRSMTLLGFVLIQRSAIGKYSVHGLLASRISLLFVFLGFGSFFLPFQRMEGARECYALKTYLGLE